MQCTKSKEKETPKEWFYDTIANVNYELSTKDHISVGRNSDNDIVVPKRDARNLAVDNASMVISRHHCTLNRAVEGLMVKDNGSSNGTFIDDREVGKNGYYDGCAEQALLQNGQTLKLGDYQLEFIVENGED
jgi:pSer/pThr/pTyr-binding forkhead associated (FHA) protein